MGQQPDTVDTLLLRSGNELYIPRWDTLKQLRQANEKADTIMSDLQVIKCKLGLMDDTTKVKKKDGH